MSLNISSRKSDLARLQAFLVGETLRRVQPDLKIDYHFKESLGDVNLTDPLWKIPQKGVFTEDFNQDLLLEKTDLVVHSWKDLPVEKKANLSVVATLPRADQRDIILIKKNNLSEIYKFKKINLYSSSPRRFYNIEPFLKSHFPYGLNEVHFESVRGNIPTRLNKLMAAPEIDGLILAKAALDRLLLTEVPELQETKKQIQNILQYVQWMVLPLSANPNAAAQGALAIEIKDSNQDLKNILEKINHPLTFYSAQHERTVLASYGGGCHQKIGVASVPHKYGQVVFLKGLTDQGQVLDQKTLTHEKQKNIFKKYAPDQLWSDSTSNKYFDRKNLDFTLPQDSHFFISKADAVNSTMTYSLKNHVLWTAGTATWKKLALQGLWINGTQDGLGEAEPRYLEALIDSEVPWVKLSHSDASHSEKTIACYGLIRNKQAFDFKSKECFFWNSGSLFLAALKEHPEIATKVHCCGPGNTAEMIQSTLKNSLWQNLFIFLNQEQWSHYVTQ